LTTTGKTAAPEIRPQAPKKRGGNAVQRLIRLRPVEASLTFLAFIAIFIGYVIWLGNTFASVSPRLIDVHQNAPILLLALAAIITLIPGLFDLSITGMATLTAFLAVGLCVNQGLPFGLVLVICVLVGVVGGALNGFLVEGLGVNTFIATLGTGGIFLGMSAVYGDGAQVAATPEGHQLPEWYKDLGAFTDKAPAAPLWILSALALVGAYLALGRWRPGRLTESAWRLVRAGILVVAVAILVFVLDFPEWIENTSWLVFVLLVAAIVIWILLQFTSFGRHLKATGSNRTAARLAGVPVRWTVVSAFVVGGVLSAIAGVLLASTQGLASPDMAGSFLLPAFAAAFLSTVVFSTGQFTVWGTIIGGIFIVWVRQGLIVGGLPPTWTDVVNGAVLVLAVALSTVMRRRSGSAAT
jgi:ribose/xylose/arabinose/galactoside ABC-type transport system permease subunit